MAKKGKVLTTVIDITGSIDPQLSKSIKAASGMIDTMKASSVAFSAAAVAATSAAMAGITAAASYLTDLGGAYDSAANGIAATTGLVGEELEGLETAMQAVYGAQYGESLQEIADGVSEVFRLMKVTGEELEDTTSAAFALKETFGYDISESARAAKAIMTNFGESGEYAMGLIAAGAQNGLDYSGELLDSVSEYSVQFAKLGFSADDMFHIFQRGADSGAWNLDKVGDAIKEFSIRSIDGSKTTKEAFKTLGFSSKEAMSIFAAGGEEAEYAFQVVLKELIAMENQVKRDEVGVALFGTMWEDLGVEAVASMIDVQGGLYDTEDALGKINAVKYDSLDAAMEGIKRNAEVQLIPAAEAVTDAFIDIAPEIQEMVNLAMPCITSLAESIGPAITAAVTLANDGIAWLTENGGWLVPVLSSVTSGFVAFKAAMALSDTINTVKTAMNGMTLAQYAVTAAQNAMNVSIAWIPIGIAAAVTAAVWLFQNWELVMEWAAMLGDFLAEVWTGISEGVSNFLNGITEGFVSAFSALAGIVKGPINAVIGIVNGAINAINSIGFTIPDWVPLIGGEAFSVNIPNIPMLAAGGHTDGVSIAGEAGMETVISYDAAYRSDNLSYWAEAGRMLGVSDYLLGDSSGDYYDFSGLNPTFNVTVNGNAEKQDIIDAIEEVYPEFVDLLEEWVERRSRHMSRCGSFA